MKSLSLLFLLLGCERAHVDTNPHQVGETYKLYLFAAGYCKPCKEELPEIQRWHKTYKYNGRIRASVYFIAGNPAIKPATQEDADKFRKDLGLAFPVIPDRYAKTYKTFYQSGTSVPATVITTDKDEIVKVFAPGKVSPEMIEEVIK